MKTPRHYYQASQRRTISRHSLNTVYERKHVKSLQENEKEQIESHHLSDVAYALQSDRKLKGLTKWSVPSFLPALAFGVVQPFVKAVVRNIAYLNPTCGSV